MAQFHVWNSPGQIDEGLNVPFPPPVAGVPNILGEFSTLAGLPQDRCDMFRSGLKNGYSGAFPWAYRAKDTQSLPLLGEETRSCLRSLPRFTFTQDPIIAGVTPVRAIDIKELRVSVDTLRLGCNPLGLYAYTNQSLLAGVSTIHAVDFTEPRTALGEYYSCRSLPLPVYSLPDPARWVTVMGRHLAETRAAALTAQ